MSEKWFSLSVSDIEKKLKTSAALGLNHKAARSRFSARNGLLFEASPRTPISLLPALLTDFSVIILLLMAIVALCFGEGATGGVCLLVALLSLAVSLVIYYRDEKYFSSVRRAISPRCRVIRQGRLYSLAPRHVVVGDIILLGEGDVVPADARLITSDSLEVKMLVEKGKYILLRKLAEGAVVANENDPTRFLNMVHAGSVVVGGAARAVVTAVGQYTYVGAKIGSIVVESSAKSGAGVLLTRIKKVLSSASMALLAATLPISVVAMIFGGDRLSLFSVFMTALCCAFLCSSQLVLTAFRLFYEVPAKRCIMAKDAAVVAGPSSFDTLDGSKYLFLLDGGALTDGIWHLDGICLGDGEYKDYSTLPESAKRLAELSYIYLDAKKATLSVGSEQSGRYDDGIRDFIQKANVDKDALKIRCSTSGYIERSAGAPCDKVMFSERGSKYVLSVSYSDEIIEECGYALFEDSALPASSSFKYSARETFCSYAENGKRALIFCLAKNEGYGVEGEKCFVGMVAFAEHTDGVTEKAKREIEARGIKVVSFKNIIADAPVAVSRIPESMLGDERLDVRDFVAASKPLSHRLGEIDCYVNFTVGQVVELIEHIHKKGERVTVVGICDKFERIYRAADAVVTVSLNRYSAEPLENVVSVKIDPSETRTEEGAQAQRQRADAVIPRYTEGKGGLSSLVTAFKGASMATANLVGFFRYLVVMQLTRLVLIVLPMLLGALTADARHLLLAGVLADLIALVTFAFDKRSGAGGYDRAVRSVISPLRENARELLVFAGGALLSSLLPVMLSLITGLPAYIDRTEYSFVSLIFFEIAVFVCIRIKSRVKFTRLSLVLPIALAALLGLSFVGGVADVLDIEGFSNIVYFFVSLLSPIVSVLVCLILGRQRGQKKVNCK